MKKKQRALVILDGYPLTKNYLDFFWEKSNIRICADGSYYSVNSQGFHPDFVIGDFDSFSNNPTSAKTKCLKFSEQNTTDTEKIFLHLMKMPVSFITIIGLLGSRLDHLFWNLNLIKKYQKKFEIECFTPTEKLLISNKKKEKFFLPKGTRISLFPFYQEVKNITSSGLKYELDKEQLSLENFVSISNETLQPTIVLEWSQGELLIFLEQKFLFNL